MSGIPLLKGNKQKSNNSSVLLPEKDECSSFLGIKWLQSLKNHVLAKSGGGGNLRASIGQGGAHRVWRREPFQKLHVEPCWVVSGRSHGGCSVVINCKQCDDDAIRVCAKEREREREREREGGREGEGGRFVR